MITIEPNWKMPPVDEEYEEWIPVDLKTGEFPLPDGVDALLRLVGIVVQYEYSNQYSLMYKRADPPRAYCHRYRIEPTLADWQEACAHLVTASEDPTKWATADGKRFE